MKKLPRENNANLAAAVKSKIPFMNGVVTPILCLIYLQYPVCKAVVGL
jgi:hypothetical protein